MKLKNNRRGCECATYFIQSQEVTSVNPTYISEVNL